MKIIIKARFSDAILFEGEYESTRVEEKDMTPEELAAYYAGYDQETDKKDWGR